MDGYSLDLDEAEKACKLEVGSLPQAARMLREPIAALLTYEGWDNDPSLYRFDAVDRMQATYENFCDVLGQRHIRGCDIIDDTAEALRDIVTLYRRVDGQA
jgi:hypothetical protein